MPTIILAILRNLALIAMLVSVGCTAAPAPKRVAIVLTNPGQLGDTGKPTGF